ncbi:hypothetical protein B0I27_110117 [Arcticibacter pallidicorallinus]|uniref:Glycoamylase-like domain-containing protein n=1 Tax=Arcticibacter pallidicorallinus TaxID=1259464 RepID=A0A2T0TWB3_9SPHI|nr:glucoamylase family protein [Arcticibacter pallidicorallinus]PRY49943.1 hypothetical protein B0I27_110117 [Arcticibacter pallidicorallinus]
MKSLQILYLVLILLMSACGGSKKTNSATASSGTDSLTDDSLLTLVQKRTFDYFWEGAEPNSGMARERIHIDGEYPQNDQDVVTIGGSGFGVMAILVGVERKFISREEAVERLSLVVDFLGKADRFHGAWPHWFEGKTGKVKPFSKKDNGGDLVETAFMAQGLICVSEYFRNGNEEEQGLANRADSLWKSIDWSWYRKNGENVLYWHWSPQFGWEMNFAVRGYDECLMMYLLAAASPTHGVPADVYHEGWARNGAIKTDAEQFGYKTILSHNGSPGSVGPLFWAHYSYLGLDPTGLKDKYADYWALNKNHTLIHRAYAIQNPKGYKGYGEKSWGLTASYSVNGYAGHKPGEDLGVISPTAAISSYPYTPEYSVQVIRYLYEDLEDKVWGKYGFYDAFSETEHWYPQRYLAIDQGPQVVMIENGRSGLLWKLFMKNVDVQNGLNKLGFESPHLKR